MDRIARPKDDLFDNSTMTFGEHLKELQASLVRASIWLAAGVAIGFLFASSVVDYVKKPLEVAIYEYNADRGLLELGYADVTAEQVRPIRDFMAREALVPDVIYELPESLQTLRNEDIQLQPATGPAAADGPAADGPAADGPADAGGVRAVVDPLVMSQLLTQLPDVSSLQPKLQFRRNRQQISSFDMTETFLIWFKAALVVGALIASPGIFYHLWTFVAAGLHAHERQYVYMYLPISITLFVAGVALAFFLVLQYVITFLLGFNASMDVAFEPRLNYYISFVLLLPLGFGVAFQLPLVMLVLQRIDLFTTKDYISSWRVATMVIFIVSMLVTPADWVSMVALAVPLMVLYFLGILMCLYLPRGRGLGSAAYDPA